MYIRSGYLAVLILVLLWLLLSNASGGAVNYRELALSGASSFELVAYLQIGLICILAPVFMAGAIAQEADPRTWEVLLTTPMGALEIVLGNLLGRLFFILALLVSSLPLFALTQFFGGVPGRSIFASYGIACSAALLVGAIAIALSVSRLAGRRAVFTFYVAVVSYLAVTFAADYWMRSAGLGAGPGGNGVTWMTAINPFLSLYALLNPAGYPRAEATVAMGALERWFLTSPVSAWCWGSSLLSVALVAVSAVTARTGGLAAIAHVGSRGGVPWYRRMFGLGGAGAEYRPPRHVWTNPIAWREAAARNSTLGKIAARWSFIAVGLIVGVVLIWAYHVGRIGPTDFQTALLALVWGTLAVSALVAINMAATAVSREREDGTLDLLLTTPITPGEYLTGKLRGLVAYLLPMLAVPLGTLAMAGLYVAAGGLGRAGGVMIKVTPSTSTIAVTAPVVLPEAGAVAALVAVPFIAFCVMVGLQWSLKSRGTISSVIASVGVVGAVSGVVGACGWWSGSDLNTLGPSLAALSPASALYSLVQPVHGMTRTIVDAGGSLASARVALIIGACCAAALYLGVVYGVHSQMVRTFDMTVRKLAGVK